MRKIVENCVGFMEKIQNYLDNGKNERILLPMATDTDRKDSAMSTMSIFNAMDNDAAQQIIAMYGDNDYEANHHNADEILLDILKQLGFDKTVEAFKHLPKWYA